MHIEELATQIIPLSRELEAAAQKRFDSLIKPVGSLAMLEEMTSRYAAIIGSSDKQLVVVPEVRLLMLWGTEAHKDRIESILLGEAPVLALAGQVHAKVLPQFLTSDNAYDLVEEGAMLTSEYVNEEKAGVLCQGSLSPSPLPERWQRLLGEEDGLRFLAELDCPESVPCADPSCRLRACASLSSWTVWRPVWLPRQRRNSMPPCRSTATPGPSRKKQGQRKSSVSSVSRRPSGCT